MTTLKRKIAVRRIAALCVTAVLAGLAINATIAARRSTGRFAKWETDRPVDMLVDFSKTGVSVMAFHQTCETAHSEAVFLDVEGVGVWAETLDGLAGTMSILYGDTVVESSDLADAGTFEDGTGHKRLMLARFSPFGTGTYELKIQIDNAAPRVAGHAQRLSAQYMLCGMEKLPELMEHYFAVLLWILVVTVGGPSVVGWFRYGWRVRAARV